MKGQTQHTFPGGQDIPGLHNVFLLSLFSESGYNRKEFCALKYTFGFKFGKNFAFIRF